MNKYEAMFIIKPDLSEEERKNLLGQIGDAVAKNNGSVTQAAIWADRKKLFFPIKRCTDGVYYLVNFNAAPEAITNMNQIYRLNENILRSLIVKLEK